MVGPLPQCKRFPRRHALRRVAPFPCASIRHGNAAPSFAPQFPDTKALLPHPIPCAPEWSPSVLRDLLGDRRWPHTFPGQIPKRTATNRKKARGAKPKALHGGAGHSFRGKAGLCLRGGVRFGGDASGCLGESPRFDRPGRIVNLYGGATVWKTSWAAA